MSWDVAFDDLMNDTVTVASVASRDVYGARTFNTAVSYSNCRVVYKTQRIVNFEGKETFAAGTVWFSGSDLPDISPHDQLTLPDTTTPPILQVSKFPDEDGDHHIKVSFGVSSGVS